MESMETDTIKRAPIYTSRLWRIKLGLRSFDIACLAIITAMGISIINEWNDQAYGIFFVIAFVGPVKIPDNPTPGTLTNYYLQSSSQRSSGTSPSYSAYISVPAVGASIPVSSSLSTC